MSEQNNTLTNNPNIDEEILSEWDAEWEQLEKNKTELKKKKYKKRSSHRDHKSESTDSSPLKKKKHTARKIILGILIFVLCVIIGIVIAFVIMKNNGEKKVLNYNNLNLNLPKEVDSEGGGNVIHYKGHTYEFNKNIATILFMGIDNNELIDNAVAGTAGQADALYLFTYDTNNGSIKVLALNRDTITDVTRYDEAGYYYDTASTQLCLAYAYGDGKKFSAQNQLTAVERLIFNIPINCYYAIDLSAIKILNDNIGGVTLTPEYTFSQFKAGETITIRGDMAENFVRSRDTSMLDDNIRRMACQRQYLEAYVRQMLSSIKKDFSIPGKLYKNAAQYTVTNINISDLFFLTPKLASNYSGLNFVTTKGKYKLVKGDEAAQFHLDKEDFFEKILDIFYKQIQ